MFASLQPLIIGVIFLRAGTWKIFDPKSKDIAIRSTLSLFFKKKITVRLIFLSVGIVEFFAGLLLLFPPNFWWEMAFAGILGAGFMIYLLISLILAPQRPCGCLGARQVPLSWRTIVRACLLLALTITSFDVKAFWFLTLTENPWSLSLAGAELLTFLILSPELDWNLMKLIRTKKRQSHSKSESNCAAGEVPLATIIEHMALSEAYQALSRFLISDLLEHWNDGCWSFLCFDAEYAGKKALAVFAVSSLHNPYRVKGTIIDEVENEVLVASE